MLGDNPWCLNSRRITYFDRFFYTMLLEIRKILKSLQGISFHEFGASDVVRHHLVQKIVEAYDAYRNPSDV